MSQFCAFLIGNTEDEWNCKAYDKTDSDQIKGTDENQTKWNEVVNFYSSFSST